jgi:hypothetical protein
MQLCDVITGDETWIYIYLDNPRNSMWLDSVALRPERPERVRRNIGSKKVMITFFWSCAGVMLIDIMNMKPTDSGFTKFTKNISYPV